MSSTVGRMSAADPAHLRAELAEIVDQLLAGPAVWYVWGGSRSPDAGLDCSGLVEWATRRLSTDVTPDPRATTDDLWRDLLVVAEPEPGDLALYGRGLAHDPASHVMVVMGPGKRPGEYRVAGMSGGGSRTVSLVHAREQGARLQQYPSHLYRRDFIGFRRIDFTKTPGVSAGKET